MSCISCVIKGFRTCTDFFCWLSKRLLYLAVSYDMQEVLYGHILAWSPLATELYLSCLKKLGQRTGGLQFHICKKNLRYTRMILCRTSFYSISKIFTRQLKIWDAKGNVFIYQEHNTTKPQNIFKHPYWIWLSLIRMHRLVTLQLLVMGVTAIQSPG